ncbi:Integrin Beta-3 [Manis pentadactyla]|nr:Integrin Beta-3 [Manis pentadactyla]
MVRVQEHWVELGLNVKASTQQKTALGVGSLLVTWGMFLKFPRETLLPQNVFSTNPTFLLITLYLTMFSIEQKFTLTLQLEQVKTFHLGRKTQDPSTLLNL